MINGEIVKDNKDKKMLMGMPCGSGQVPSLMVNSLMHLRKPISAAFLIVDRQRIDKCRNYFVQQAIDNDFDYLFMVDDDNPIPPETLELMIEDDKDIVIAPIATRNPNPQSGKHDLCAYYKETKDVGDGKTLDYYNFIEKFIDTGHLHKIDAGGTGAILIKRKVLEAIVKEYTYPFEFGDVTVNGQRRTMSEDAEFCERATKLGFEIYLDERITPIHLGQQQQIIWRHGM